MLTQRNYISQLYKKNKDAIIIGSLGTISKDLTDLGIGISIRGGMGMVMGIGLGYALATKKKVIVLVGEGSFLMKLGSIATINKYRPRNLKVIILNNGKYASCGGQKNNVQNIFSNVLSYLPPRIYQVLKVS